MSKFYTNVDTRGSKVFLRYVEDGEHKQEVIEFKPELYLKTNDRSKADAMSMWDEPLEAVIFQDSREMNKFIESYKDVDGFSVYGTESIMNQYVSRNYPGDVAYDPTKIKGAILDIETFSGDIDAEGNPIDGPFPNVETAEYPINLITVYDTVQKVYLVWGLETFNGHHLGTYKHNPDSRVGKLKIIYKGFHDEKSLLDHFVGIWNQRGYNFWSGWHIEGFDNPYLTNRIAKVCGESVKKKLSPWNMVNKSSITTGWGEEQTMYEWIGCQMLDYKQLFEKHGFANPDNMKLDTVARYILGEGKIDYKDEGNLNTLYVRNYQKCVEYNIIDVNLIVLMNNKKRFFELTHTLAYLCKANYQDTLGTVRPWSALTYSMLYDKGQRPKIKSVYEGDTQFGGGFVREIKGGRYRWVVSCDLNSLYPHLKQQYNLGPETIVEPEDLPDEIRQLPNFTLDDLVNKRVDLSVLKKYNICMTANRAFFRRGKKSIFNEKTRQIYDDRKKVKKEMLKLEQELVNLEALIEKQGKATAEQEAKVAELEIGISSKDAHQHSLKILMNSLFGAIGNKWFKEAFDIRVAEGITLSGKLSILWIARKLDEYMNKVLGTGTVLHKIHHTNRPAATSLEVVSGKNYAIYQDTDSCYLDMSALVDKMFTAEQQKNEVEKIVNFLDKLFETKIEPYIDTCYKELAEYMNADDQRMFMKREVIATSAIWTAKKRYTMLVANSEGVNYMPKMYHKTTGLDAVKGSAPKHCREWMLEGYKIALEGTEDQIQEFCGAKKKEFMALPIEKIATPTGVNGLEKYSDPQTIYTKGSPKQVKAALWHNALTKKLSIKIPDIKSGDKILHVELKNGNPKGIDVIGFQGKLPQEFGLDKYVDYESNFEKSFLNPLDNLLKAINWSHTKQASALDWFN